MGAVLLTLAGLLALASASNHKVVCYFGSWSLYRAGNGKFDIAKIDPSLCTHLIYSFVGLNADGTVHILDSWADLAKDHGLNGYGKINALKAANPNLKTMIAMGGWNEGDGDGNSKYSRVMANPSLRYNLVKSIVSYVEDHGFDGFDLDWEYPGTAREGGAAHDKHNCALFLKELKEAFRPKGLLLSAAVAASPKTAYLAYDIPEMARYLDFINLMEYDFHGQWDKQTGHNAPLYPGSWESEDNKILNVDASIQYWLQYGAPAEKLVMGIPLYGRGFTLTDHLNNGVNAPTNGGTKAGPYTKERGMLGYNEICESMNEWKVVFDKEQRVPYAFNGDQWVSYDDERSIAEKGDYAKKYGLGGMMVWSLETDDFRGACGESWPLLKAINRVLNGNGGSASHNTAPSRPQRPRPQSPIQQAPNNHVPQVAPQPSYSPPQPSYAAPRPRPEHSQTGHQHAGIHCSGPGYVSDPVDCRIFYQCQQYDSYYLPFKMACPDTLAFNPNINVCDYRTNVRC